MKKSDIRKDGKRTKGFTLIELLVVVVIIGILAAIATPIYLNQRKAAWKATAISDVSTGTLAVESVRTQAPDGSLSGVQFGGGQDGQPMTITLNGSTSKSPVSPGNTETAWTGKTASGEECYAVMTTNKNVGSDWAAVRTSVSGQLTTGTPPANGSADCPRPAAPAPDPTDPAACDVHGGYLNITQSETITCREITGTLQIEEGAEVSAPNLEKIDLDLQQFGTLAAPKLTTIGGSYVEDSKNATIERPALISIGGSFQLTESSTTLSMLALTKIGGRVDVWGTLHTPALTTIGGKLYNWGTLDAAKLSSVNGKPYPAA